MSAEKEPLFGSCRLVLTVMVFFGVYHLMALRFNLSMALGRTEGLTDAVKIEKKEWNFFFYFDGVPYCCVKLYI